MTDFPKVKWLLDCKPRDVQIEATARSFYGFKIKDHRDDEPNPKWLRKPGPALGWGHWMEMRLGKTPTMYNEFELFMSEYGMETLFIFSPNSYKVDWALEATKFGVSIPLYPYETSDYKSSLKFLKDNKGKCGLVINYESLIYNQTKDLLEKHVNKTTVVAADESIKLKNPSSLTSKSALLLTKEAAFTRTLTGLPMTQGPQDLYTQLRFGRQLSGSNFYSFRNRFCKMGGFKNKKVVGPRNEEELKEVLIKGAFVAKRKDWGRPTVPEYYDVMLSMHPVQARYYKEMDKDFITMLDSGQEITVDQVISKMMKLQQISSGFVYDETGVAIDLIDPTETPKVKKLLELLEDEIEGKVVIPYHYSKSGDVLREVLKQYEPAVIRSSQWMKKNELDANDEKSRFNTDPKCKVMIANIQNIKYGHFLAGNEKDRCSTMVFYENTYSLDDRSQVEMRNTAAEQDWTNVYLDFVSSPVEKNAIKALVAKENVVSAVLGAYTEGKTRSTF